MLFLQSFTRVCMHVREWNRCNGLFGCYKIYFIRLVCGCVGMRYQ